MGIRVRQKDKKKKEKDLILKSRETNEKKTNEKIA
jgi:hypothetical protein